MERTFNHDILPLIKTRWSPRAVSPEPLPGEDILALVEAARYAPSCFNEQPWHFVIADEPESLAAFRSVLTESNRQWAGRAPVLVLVSSRDKFTLNGNDNFWHQFDAGTAWGFLSLEAERRGLVAHAMGGFDRAAAANAAVLPDGFIPLAMIAVGKHGRIEDLPESFRDREFPGTRKNDDEICSFGVYGKRRR
jgi:nitroreductase